MPSDIFNIFKMLINLKSIHHQFFKKIHSLCIYNGLVNPETANLRSLMLTVGLTFPVEHIVSGGWCFT